MSARIRRPRRHGRGRRRDSGQRRGAGGRRGVDGRGLHGDRRLGGLRAGEGRHCLAQAWQRGCPRIDAFDQVPQAHGFYAVAARDRLLGRDQHVRLQLGQRGIRAPLVCRRRAGREIVLHGIVAGRRQHPVLGQCARGARIGIRGHVPGIHRHDSRGRGSRRKDRRGRRDLPARRHAQHGSHPDPHPARSHAHPLSRPASLGGAHDRGASAVSAPCVMLRDPDGKRVHGEVLAGLPDAGPSLEPFARAAAVRSTRDFR